MSKVQPIDPRDAFEHLRRASTDGALGELCRRFDVSLVTVFGSVARGEPRPNDLDVAVWFTGEKPDVLGFLDQLTELADYDVDMMDLRRADPVARHRALVGAILLYERSGSLFATEQLKAIMEYLDTAWLRRLDLETLAG